MQKREIQYHIQCAPGDVGRYCILPGDPGRCEAIAQYFDQRRWWPATVSLPPTPVRCWENQSVSAPPASAALPLSSPWRSSPPSERIPLSGWAPAARIALKVKSDDVVIATGAIRHEGASREYAPIEFPAVSDYQVQQALADAARSLGKPWHAGVVQCKDSFYGQHDPGRCPCPTSFWLNGRPETAGGAGLPKWNPPPCFAAPPLWGYAVAPASTLFGIRSARLPVWTRMKAMTCPPPLKWGWRRSSA